VAGVPIVTVGSGPARRSGSRSCQPGAACSSVAGFSGRVRSFPDQGERARVAVGKAIRRALARISEADPILGEHLRQAVHTGIRCSYWPG
jgi:hypothetical protein